MREAASNLSRTEKDERQRPRTAPKGTKLPPSSNPPLPAALSVPPTALRRAQRCRSATGATPRPRQGPPPPPHRSSASGHCRAAAAAPACPLTLPPHTPCARVPSKRCAQPSAEPPGRAQLAPTPPVGGAQERHQPIIAYSLRASPLSAQLYRQRRTCHGFSGK